MMTAVLVRNLKPETHLALKHRARLHGSSTEAEIRSILDAAVQPQPEVGLGTQLQEFGRKYGALPEIKRDRAALEPAVFE